MTPAAKLSFIHRYEPATDASLPPLLLLHGTGGDENDLIDLGRAVAPDAALLSPRGKVLEGGSLRFFRRFAEGKFDEDDVRKRANELADLIGEARQAYGLSAPIALGFSNGANIAAATLLLRREVLSGAVLLRAMVPLSQPLDADLSGKPVLILSGSMDSMIPAANATRLASILERSGANVQHRTLPAGHGLSQADVTIAHDFLRRTRAEIVSAA
jgi:phospholipase/carboxylesterase